MAGANQTVPNVDSEQNDDELDDDYYEDSFEGYVATTVDPGNWMIIGTLIFCMFSVLILACMLRMTQKKRKAIEAQHQMIDTENGLTPEADKGSGVSVSATSTEDSGEDSMLTEEEDDNEGDAITNARVLVDVMVSTCGREDINVETTTSPLALRKKNSRRIRGGASLQRGLFHQDERSPGQPTLERLRKLGIRYDHDSSIEVIDERLSVSSSADRVTAGKAKEMGSALNLQMDGVNDEVPTQVIVDAVEGVSITSDFHQTEEEIAKTLDQPSSKRLEQTPEMDAISKSSTLKQLCRDLTSFGKKVRRTAQYDKEMKKIIKLAIPYSLTALFECISDILTVAVIGRLLGTRELAAYIAVNFALSLTTLWLKGLLDSMATLCSQASGLGEKKLAGQYFQIAVLLSQILYIPQMVFWIFFIDDLIIWLGFDEATAEIGYNFAVVLLLNGLFEFVYEGLHNFLEVCDYEELSAIISISQSFVEFIAILSVALTSNPSLQTIGIVHFLLDILFFILTVAFIELKGLFKTYWPGIIGSFAFRNTHAVKHLISTAVPLSIAAVLSDGEWEVLLLLARFLGPAEVVAWGIYGELWEGIEIVTEALGDAAEVRCAYLLGADKPMRAKQSAQKSILVGFIEGLFLVFLLAVCGNFLPSWMTDDPTIQAMLKELIPLFCIGVLFDTVGSISFALVGAQGYYALATAVIFIGSWLVTIPLGLVFTKAISFNLQGLAAAVVVGNTLSGLVNTFLLFDSDWYYYAALTRQRNIAERVN